MTVDVINNFVIDNLGRKIKLKEITGRTRVSFYRALGPKDASNVGVMSEYWNVMAVDSIDDEPMGALKQLIDIEAIFAKLEKSNAIQLIDEWLIAKKDEKDLAKDEADSLKK